MNEVVMPRLGWTMESGRVVEWLKHDGDVVAPGEAIFTVEADKGISEVEALDGGVLRIPGDSPLGIEVPVGTTLAYISPDGLPGPLVHLEGSQVVMGTENRHDDEPVSPSPREPRESRSELPPISPRARRRANELRVDWTVITGTGRTGRIVERDVLAAIDSSAAGRPRATPTVRKLADDVGIGLTAIAASGPSGRVTRADVLGASARQAPVALGQPMSQIRKLVSERMAAAARVVAPVTLTTEADATELMRFRLRLKEDLAGTADPVPSITDFVIRIVALALLEHPDLNASIAGDSIIWHEAVHVGIAVDTDRGLLAPVVRDAHQKSLHAIAVDSARLIDAARLGRAAADDLTGSTFTVTNLGMYEIDAFTPIVNIPESAILGLGRIAARPVIVDEERETIAVRKMMALSLTFDHRVVDGAPAARFLQRCKQMIERPHAPLTR